MTSIYCDQNKYNFVQQGGEVAAHIRMYCWEKTSLGDAVSWPQRLKTTLSIVLSSRFPTFLFWGPDHICFYNDAYYKTLEPVGRYPLILGKPAAEVVPEVWKHAEKAVKRIFLSGETEYAKDIWFPLYYDKKSAITSWSLSYSCVIDESQTTGGVIVICHETSDKTKIINNLPVSEHLAESAIQNAPIGMFALAGDECIIEIVNAPYSRLVGKTIDELIEKPFLEDLTQADQQYGSIIENVKQSYQPTLLKERPYIYFEHGESKEGFMNLIFYPYKVKNGETMGVMVLCHDVTEYVISRMAMETAIEQIKIYNEAAQLGIFDLNIETGALNCDKRCRLLFGINHENEISYEKDFIKSLHPNDREHIIKIIQQPNFDIENNIDYDIEYRIVGIGDEQLRWVCSKGKIFYNEKHSPVRFIASVKDITKEKLREFRKTDFVSIVSHELKTPLTLLTGILQLADLKLKNHPDNSLAKSIGKAVWQVNKMKNMINGFLNLATIESGMIHLGKTEFCLNELIATVIEELLPTTTCKLCLQQPTDIIISADRDKMESVMVNLLTNAIKYSPTGKEIWIKIEQSVSEVLVDVIDQGIGINEQDLGNVFGRYYRVKDDATRHVSGFGIGLYLSMEIVRLHNGRMWAESTLGQGSKFSFALPLYN